MITVSFPGIGIDSFELNPVAFTLFGKLEIRWYAIFITLGMIFAFFYCAYRAKQEKISFDDLLDITIFTIIFGVIGARLYYVLFQLDKYDSLYSMIAIWEGGLAIYGGLIAGALTIFLVCRHKKIKFLKMFDAVAPGVMVAQALGRWGNFFNGEAYGEEILEGSLFSFIRMGLIPNIESHTRMFYFHPTFLYESVWNILGFVFINLLYKKKKFDGQIFYMYISWYGFGRMLIEGLRTDSLTLGEFRVSQIVGFVCFVVGLLLLIINLVKSRRERLTALDYDAAYPKFATTASTGSTAETDADADNAEEETAQGEDTYEEEYPSQSSDEQEHNDVSEKLGKLFNIDSNDDK